MFDESPGSGPSYVVGEALLGEGGEPFSLLGRQLPRAFRLRVVSIPPGAEQAFDEAAWGDTLAVVERGELEVVCANGTRRRFRRGDVLWLSGLHLRSICQCGGGPSFWRPCAGIVLRRYCG
jgi:quercetin dioxygenase-like cupin family protein